MFSSALEEFPGRRGYGARQSAGSACRADRAQQFDGHLIRHIGHVEQDVVALLTRVE